MRFGVGALPAGERHKRTSTRSMACPGICSAGASRPSTRGAHAVSLRRGSALVPQPASTRNVLPRHAEHPFEVAAQRVVMDGRQRPPQGWFARAGLARGRAARPPRLGHRTPHRRTRAAGGQVGRPALRSAGSTWRGGAPLGREQRVQQRGHLFLEEKAAVGRIGLVHEAGRRVANHDGVRVFLHRRRRPSRAFPDFAHADGPAERRGPGLGPPLQNAAPAPRLYGRVRMSGTAAAGGARCGTAAAGAGGTGADSGAG